MGYLKKPFQSKVKRMDDRGIMQTFHLCAWIFEFLVQAPIFNFVGMGYMYPISYEVFGCLLVEKIFFEHVPHSVRSLFFTFKVGKTQLRGLCVSTL